MGLIRTILILILIVYLVRFIDKYIVPVMFGKSRDKPPSAGKGEGDVTIEDHRSGNRRGGKKSGLDPEDGEYVDYEEVDD